MKKINTDKLLKAYTVNFAQFSGGEDMLNVSSTNVLAETAEQAIERGKENLTTIEKKTYYVESVEMITYID